MTLARFYRDLTEHALLLAGLRHGYRVLDVGCGPGDMAFLAARLVGLDGFVIGVDRAEAAVDIAGERAAALGLPNVRFLVGDVTSDELVLDGPVDAIVGRAVLTDLPDPAGTVRRLLRHLRPGGLVLFQEMVLASMTSEPACPLYEETAARVAKAYARAGMSPRNGLLLRRVLRDAGLPDARLIQHARVEGGPDSGVYRFVAEIVRAAVPLMERHGVATAAEIDVDTLAERLRVEAEEYDAVLVPPPLVAAWARLF